MLPEHLSDSSFGQHVDIRGILCRLRLMLLAGIDADGGTFTPLASPTELSPCLLRRVLSLLLSRVVVGLAAWRRLLRKACVGRAHLVLVVARLLLSLAVLLVLVCRLLLGQVGHERDRRLIFDLVTLASINFVLVARHHIILADCAPQ